VSIMAALASVYTFLRLYLQEAEGIFDGEESGVLDLGRPNTQALTKNNFLFYNKQRKIVPVFSKTLSVQRKKQIKKDSEDRRRK
jgi:hypothetical protein